MMSATSRNDSEPLDGSTGALRDTLRALVRAGRFEDGWNLIRPQLLRDDDPATWNLGRRVLDAAAQAGWDPAPKREIRLAVLCSYESAELVSHLRVACSAFGIGGDVHVAPFGQLEQEAFAPDTPLTRFAPTHVLVAPTTLDLTFPALSDDPGSAVGVELRRWQTLWRALEGSSGARVVHHGFVVPDESPFGHLAARLPGSRLSLVRELNRGLGGAAGSSVLLVDVERIAAGMGKGRWFDPRLWYAARQPFAHAALPPLARETAAVFAGDVGLAPRCIVVDLDNTLWGGVVGDDGPEAIVVGSGPDGEAFAAFQDYLLALRGRGVLLAVASKNDLDAAREPFERNPDMKLSLGDFAAFVADWRPKSEQIAEIAETLELGLDSLVFADDNPAECAQVASALPAVTTIVLDVPPSEFVRTLAASVHLEASSFTGDDQARAGSYSALRKAEELRHEVPSLDDFWRSLEMRARVRDVDSASLERAAQLTQKTNQFNLTLARRTPEQVKRLAEDPAVICRTLELEDRFARHGIVGLVIATPADEDDTTVEIDTLLLSCRVIGRTAERHLVADVSRAALAGGRGRLRGTYVAGPRNGLVAELYPQLGFTEVDAGRWEYDLARGPIASDFIRDEP
jgi:FkbH-like protein